MISEVFDIECLSNFFSYTGYDRASQKIFQFVICPFRNDYNDLMIHLKRKDLYMIGYNNLRYDYPVLHHMINHFDEYKFATGAYIARQIYQKSQWAINETYPEVYEWHCHVKQIDLFRMWHFDNRAKMTSLKALEFAMRFASIEEMPFDHTYEVTTEDEMNQILVYNLNDVMATNEFLNITQGETEHVLYKGKNKVELRVAMQRKTGISMFNFNDIKMGLELILDLYCKKFRRVKKEVKDMRTYRREIYLGQCIPRWAHFEEPCFNALINTLKNKTIKSTKGEFKESVIFNGCKIDYGTGGAHASIKPGVYSADEEFMILDIDADGLYPFLAIRQGLYPQHLGPEFLDIYDGQIVSVRLAEKKKPKKERDFVIIEGFKLASNGFYGKTNSADSYAYDPLYTMRTTISGQIMISMWLEKLVQNIDRLTIIQVNTDGITIKIPRVFHQTAIDITNEMTRITGLTFEFNEYSKMVISNVNNYSAQYAADGKIKHKGAFEIDKDLHKDSSMRIVKIALEQYFFYQKPIEETIKNHTNIYDFCLRFKTDKAWQSQLHYVKYDDGQPVKAVDNLGKVTRYYISNKGGSLYKKSLKDKRINGESVGWLATIFNRYIEMPMNDYNINHKFYINECNKIIRQIEDGQLILEWPDE